MAPVRWTNLPPDILSTLSNILNSDVDLLRLRSVCSSWRSSLPPRQSPISFPLKVPPLLSHPKSQTAPFYSKHEYPTLPSGGHNFISYTTLYRLSPPEHGPCAGDPSHGWLFRVSEVNPNSFSLLTPLLPAKIKCRPEMIPERLNLLHYRISEICKCYNLNFVDDKGMATSLAGVIRKVIVLPNYVVGCDFAVLVLVSNKDMRYWKFGDKDWTKIDIRKYDFDDVILFNGKCYAIGPEGVLVSFDSEFNLTVVYSSDYGLLSNYNNFVVYESDLYVVSKIYDREPDELSSDFEGRYSSPGGPGWYASDEDEDDSIPDYSSAGDDEWTDDDFSTREGDSTAVVTQDRVCSDSHTEEDDDEDEGTPGYISTGEDECSDDGNSTDEDKGSYGNKGTDEEGAGPVEISLRLKVFQMSDGHCYFFRYLDDTDIFLSSDDVSVGVSSKDFGDCKGNCVYMAHRRFFYDDRGIESGDHHGVYDFNKRRTRSFILETARDYAKICWPPPDWLNTD